jgi:hypothetical protein
MKRAFPAGMLFVLVAGCGPGFRLDVSAPPVLQEPRASAVEISWRLPEKTPVQYLYRYSQRARGNATMKEAAEGIISITNEGQMDGKFYKLYVTCRETKRQKVEVVKNRQIIDNKPRHASPAISPNVVRDETNPAVLLYPVDKYWRFGVREQSSFHYLVNDTLAYLLPAFAPRDVQAGDEWTVRIPVIMGTIYGNNEFTLTCEHKLERFVSLPSGHDAAEIAFTIEGSFDTSAEPYARRFSDAVRSSRRVVQTVSGEGRALFDLAAGLLTWKDVTYTVASTGSRERIERDLSRKTSKTYWEDESYEADTSVTWRFRQPGEPVPVR